MRRLSIIALSLAAATSLWAGQITREQALLLARQFLIQRGSTLGELTPAETAQSKARSRGQVAEERYYVFNNGQNQGYVIVSGDDVTAQILGYSDTGHFDMAQMPANMSAWLEGYAAEIAFAQSKGTTASSPRQATRIAVEPLVKSHWDQTSPYNNSISFKVLLQEVEPYTGCVATAMAQIMNYYRYPDATISEIPSYDVTYSGVKHTFEAVAKGSTIDWANMLDRYDGSETTDQQQAVADLMMYAGRSVKMAYSNRDGSSAKAYDVRDALKNYFGYSRGVAYKNRSWYESAEWEDLIYNEIANKRPVLYAGQTEKEEGHAFVVDGCDTNGYFHVNWGWGKLTNNPDGYFLLTALTPEVQGAGGSSGGYNYGQEAIIGITYGDDFTETVRATAVNATVNGGNSQVDLKRDNYGRVSFAMMFYYTNRLANDYDLDLGIAVCNGAGEVMENDHLVTLTGFHNQYTSGRGYSTYYFGSGVANGNYKFVPISRQNGSTEWLTCEDADKYTIYAQVTDDTISLRIGEPFEDPTATGIESVDTSEEGILGRYDLNGLRVSEDYRGVVVVKMKNGKNQIIVKH